MTEWKEYKLGEIASFVTEKVSVQDVRLEDYISTENMFADKGGITTASSKPTEGSATKYYTNTILISNIRPYFKKIWYANKDGGCSNDVLCFKAKERIVDSKYLYFLLSQDTFFDYVMLGSKGCKMPRGDKSHIMNWEISLPSLSTQYRIASILSSLDDKIDLLHRENATLEQMAETLFRQWFVVEAKEEWEEGKLGDLIVVKYGKDHKKLQDGKIPVIGSGGIMRYADTALYDRESVLIPRKGTLNNVMYINEPFWTVDTMFYTEMRRPNIAKFVYHFMKEQDLANMNVGSAVPSMTTEVLNNIPVDIPPQDVFDRFEKAVASLYNKKEQNNKQIQTLIQTRDGLLPKLMFNEIELS